MVKQVTPLSDTEQASLETTYRQSRKHRERQRAHAILLSAQGYSLDQLASILESDRDTISRWLDRWQERGIVGLTDAPRSGRPAKIDAQVEAALREILGSPSPNLKAAIAAELEKKG